MGVDFSMPEKKGKTLKKPPKATSASCLTRDPVNRVLRDCRRKHDLNPLWTLGEPRSLVPSLSNSALFLLSRFAEGEDRNLLLLHASTDQIQCCWDMDVWKGDTFDAAIAGDWLGELLEMPDEIFQERLKNLLPDGFGLAFLRTARILNLRIDEVLPESPVYYATPDLYFEFHPLEDTDEVTWKNLIRFLDRCYETDPEWIQQLIMAVTMEFPTALEEESFRLRNGRIRDDGFWDLYSAREIYAPVDPARISLDPVEGSVQPPPVSGVAVLSEPGEGDLLAQALGELGPEGHDAVLENLSLLCNRMMAADEVDPADAGALEELLERARAGVNLGLAYFVHHRKRTAAEVLHSLHVSRLFQCGYSLSKQCSLLAHTLMRTGIVSLSPGTYTLLEEGWMQFFEGLLLRHPRLCRGMLQGLVESKTEFFSTLEQLQLATDLLEEMSLFKGICFGLLGIPGTVLTDEGAAGTSRRTPGAMTFGDMFRTAAVALVCVGDSSRVPLPSDISLPAGSPEFQARAKDALMKELTRETPLATARAERIALTHLSPLTRTDFRDFLILSDS